MSIVVSLGPTCGTGTCGQRETKGFLCEPHRLVHTRHRVSCRTDCDARGSGFRMVFPRAMAMADVGVGLGWHRCDGRRIVGLDVSSLDDPMRDQQKGTTMRTDGSCFWRSAGVRDDDDGFREWKTAGLVVAGFGGGALHHGADLLRRIHFPPEAMPET